MAVAVLPNGSEDALAQANLTHLVVEFMKKAARGLPCTCYNENTRERCRTYFTLCTTEKHLNYLVVLSPREEEGALATCRLALMSHVFSVEHDGEQAFPPGLLDQFTNREKDLLAVVAYRKDAKDKQPVRLCLICDSHEARHEFEISVRILSVYSKTRLKSNPKSDKSFLSCLACSGIKSRSMNGTQLVDGIETAFQIYLPHRLHQHVEEQEEIDMNQERADSDGRIHVVWSLEESQMRSYAGDVSALTDQPNETEGSDKENMPLSDYEAPPNEELDLPLMCMDARGVTRTLKPSAWRIKHTKLFVADGSRMEYYSLTHKRWFPATVRVEASFDIPFGAPTYNAHLGKDQERKDVMQFLRRPLCQDHLVEVFLPERIKKNPNQRPVSSSPRRRQSGNVTRLSSSSVTRLASTNSVQSAEDRWFAGRIPFTPDKAASHSGYPVQLESSGEILQKVASWRIRHRFPRGEEVYVYKGFVDGWTSGTVAESASVDGIGAKSYRLSGFVYKDESMETHGNFYALPMKDAEAKQAESRARQQKRLGAIRRQMSGKDLGHESSHGSDNQVDPWVWVPVKLKGAANVEEFPSYLVRRRVERITV